MPQNLLDSIEINTADHCDHAVIWLHGLGASGNDFEPVVPELDLPATPGVRFVFPHAPVRPITINGGAPMRGWYDITSLDFGSRQQDTAGILDSASHVNALIEAQIENGIAPANIMLAGFSQGGAIALFTALTSKHALGGVLALSTYLPIQEDTFANLVPQALNLPIFMAHGTFDEVIQIQHAEQSRAAMIEKGLQIEWHDYPMGHSVSAEQIGDISIWLKSQLTR